MAWVIGMATVGMVIGVDASGLGDCHSASSSTSIQCRTGVAQGVMEALDPGDTVGREAHVAAVAQVTVR